MKNTQKVIEEIREFPFTYGLAHGGKNTAKELLEALIADLKDGYFNAYIMPRTGGTFRCIPEEAIISELQKMQELLDG